MFPFYSRGQGFTFDVGVESNYLYLWRYQVHINEVINEHFEKLLKPSHSLKHGAFSRENGLAAHYHTFFASTIKILDVNSICDNNLKPL